jgi:hypothetical protein
VIPVPRVDGDGDEPIVGPLEEVELEMGNGAAVPVPADGDTPVAVPDDPVIPETDDPFVNGKGAFVELETGIDEKGAVKFPVVNGGKDPDGERLPVPDGLAVIPVGDVIFPCEKKDDCNGELGSSEVLGPVGVKERVPVGRNWIVEELDIA